MIFMGRAIRENGQFNYAENSIVQAREKIKEFPTLNGIVDGFSQANSENFNKNYFLILAKNAVSDPFNNGNPNSFSESRLKGYELLIKTIISNLNKNSRESLITRLKEFGQGHFKKIIELDFFLELLSNNFVQDVGYENPQVGNHDFQIIISGKELNIELTSLGEGAPQKIIEDSFNKVAEKIIEYIPENKLLKLEIDTNLINGDSSEEISSSLMKDFLNVKPIIHAIKNGLCIFENNLGNPEKTLYEFREIYQYYNEFGERLSKLLEDDSGIEYLKNTQCKVFVNNPFSSFIIGDAKTRLVEIHSKCSWPSEAESKRKISLIRQLKNRVSEKITKGQLKGKTNPIIALNFRDTIFHDYTNDEDIFGKENLNELKEIVCSVFPNDENEILGVVLYEGTLKHFKFIQNPNLQIDGDTLLKIEKLRKIR